MEYALGSSVERAPAATDFSESIPEGTDAGTYYVWYRSAGTGAYGVSEPACVTVTIKQAMVTVSFDANGGKGSMSAASVAKGSSYTLPACTFTAPEGKEFDKWDKGAVGASINVTADTTVKAVWKDKPAQSSGTDSDGNDGTNNGTNNVTDNENKDNENKDNDGNKDNNGNDNNTGGNGGETQKTPAATEIKVTGITLKKKSAVVREGKSIKLTATVKPDNATNQKVTFKSNKNKIAKVSSDGKVTAVAPGTATITATAGGKSATCKIMVPDMKLNTKEVILKADSTNNSVQATLINDSIKSVKSSNSKIARVSFKKDTLKIRGVKTGSAKITVTSKSGIKRSLSVRVKKEAENIKTIKVASKVNVKKGKSQTLEVTTKPDAVSVGQGITVKVSDKKIAKVSYSHKSNKITIKGYNKGTCTVTVKAGTLSRTIKVTVN